VKLEDTLRRLATEVESLLNDKKEFEVMCKKIVRFVKSNGQTE
jgi:hypothetical protein